MILTFSLNMNLSIFLQEMKGAYMKRTSNNTDNIFKNKDLYQIDQMGTYNPQTGEIQLNTVVAAPHCIENEFHF